MELTVKQIADRFNVDTLAAQKFLDFLRAAKLANVTGTAPKAEGQKGKAPNVWKVPARMSFKFDTGLVELEHHNEDGTRTPETVKHNREDWIAALIGETNEKLAA